MKKNIIRFVKANAHRGISLALSLTMMLGTMPVFPAPAAAGPSDYGELITTAPNYTSYIKYNSGSGIYSADGVGSNFIAINLDVSGTWTNAQLAMLQSGGAEANFMVTAMTGATFATWSWYSPYVSYRDNAGEQLVFPEGTSAADVYCRSSSKIYRFFENKNTWVIRKISTPLSPTTSPGSIGGRVIQPRDYDEQWGDRDYGAHNRNDFKNLLLFVDFAPERYDTVLKTSPTATTIISGQKVGLSNLSGGTAVTVKSNSYVSNPIALDGSFTWANPDQQITGNNPQQASVVFTPARTNYFNESQSPITIPVRAAVISLDKRSGTGGNASADGWYNSKPANTLVPTRAGYAFKGYYTAATGGTQYFNASGAAVKNWDIAADTTLYAQWDEVCSVGNITAPAPIKAGNKLALTTPTVTGPHDSAGWQYKPTGSSDWVTFVPSSTNFSINENGCYLRYFATKDAYTAYSPNSAQIQVSKYTPTLSISASPTSPSPYTTDVVLSSTLGGANSNVGKTVTFYDDSHELGTSTTDSAGKASFVVNMPPAAMHYYRAVFNVDPINSGAFSSYLTYDITKGTQSPVTFANTADITRRYGEGEFHLPIISGGSGTGSYIFRSSNESVLTVSGSGTATIKGAGEATVYVKKVGDSNYNDSNEVSVKIVVSQKPVRIDNLSVYDKIYDQANTATLNSAAAVLGGVINGDSVAIDYTNASARFSDANARAGKIITYHGFALSGAKSGNYELMGQPASTLASITQRPVLISGITANNKTYDGNMFATVVTTGTVFENLIPGDTLSVGATGQFSDANAGTAKSVAITYGSLGGTSASNYKISDGLNQANALANITKKTLAVSPDAGQNKYYGMPDPSISYTHAGAVGTQVPHFTGSLGRATGESIGAYSFSHGSLALVDGTNGFLEDNYNLVLSPTSITFAINAYNPDAQATATPNGSNNWFKSAPVTLAPPSGYEISGSDALIDNTWANSLNINPSDGVSKSAVYYLRALAGPNTGAISAVQTFEYKIDTTAPVGDVKIRENSVKKFLNDVTFGLFFNQNVDVAITGADATSGVGKVEYYRSTDILAEQDVLDLGSSWSEYPGTLTETAVDAAKFVYYARVTDAAGNSTYFASNGTTFDTSSPAVTGIVEAATYYVDQAVTASDTNLESITLNSAPFVSGDKLGGNTVETYVVVATDKAGNSTTVTVAMKKIVSLSESIDALFLANVKSTDKVAIEAVAANVEAVLLTTSNGATVAQIDELNAIAQKCIDLLGKIQDTRDEISAITAGIDGITVANVKSNDQALLDDALARATTLLGSENLTNDERASLEQTQADIEDCLARIAALEKAVSDAYAPAAGITSDSVEKGDREALTQAANDLQSILDTDANNLTDAEAGDIARQIASIKSVITTLDELAAVEELINTLPLPSRATNADVAAIADANEAYAQLTDHQKEIVDATLKAKLSELGNALKAFTLFDSPTGTKIEGEGGTLFNTLTKLIVKPVIKTLDKSLLKKFALGVSNLLKGQELVSLFDITLMLDGQAIQPGGKVKVTFTLTDEQARYTNLHIVGIADDGTVTLIPSTIEGKEISFITDHFSYYGITGMPVKTINNTGDSTPLAPLMALGLFSLAMLALFTRKPKPQVTRG